jgi:hypothetical protein
MPLFHNFRATKVSNAFILNSLVVSVSVTLSVMTFTLINKYHEQFTTTGTVFITLFITFLTTLITYLALYYLFNYGGGMLAGKKQVHLKIF